MGAAAIALSAMVLLEMNIRWEFLFIAYFGTQFIYNYNHHKEIDIDSSTNTSRTMHLGIYHKYSKILIVIYGAIFFILLILFGNSETFLFGGLLLLIGLLFSYTIKDFFGKIAGVKLLYTSFAWGLLIPFTAIYCSHPLDKSIIIFFVFTSFRAIITTTFFDIKDIVIDTKRNIVTLPAILGKDRCLDFLHLFNFISLLPIIFGVIIGIIPKYSIFLISLFFYTYYYTQKTKYDTVDLPMISYIIVDGEFVFWPFLLMLGIVFMTRYL